jgi:hypothetical protein
MGKYLSDLGLSYETIAHIAKASPAAMTWLSAQAARKIGIDLSVQELDVTATGGPFAGATWPPPHSPIRQHQRRAEAFVVALYAAVSSSNNEALTFVGSAYANTVTYFGRPASRDRIRAYYSGVLNRWPQRSYQPRHDSLEITCDGAARSCLVKGILDIDAQSPTRRERYVASAKFEFQLIFSAADAAPIISAENGAVIERRLERLGESP